MTNLTILNSSLQLLPVTAPFKRHVPKMFVVNSFHNVTRCFKKTSDLFVLLHGGVELLGQIISYIWHSRLLLIGSAHAALVFVGLLIVLFLCIFAVTWHTLTHIKKIKEPLY